LVLFAQQQNTIKKMKAWSPDTFANVVVFFFFSQNYPGLICENARAAAVF